MTAQTFQLFQLLFPSAIWAEHHLPRLGPSGPVLPCGREVPEHKLLVRLTDQKEANGNVYRVLMMPLIQQCQAAESKWGPSQTIYSVNVYYAWLLWTILRTGYVYRCNSSREIMPNTWKKHTDILKTTTKPQQLCRSTHKHQNQDNL